VPESTIRFLHLSDTHFGVHYAVKSKNYQRRAYGNSFFQKATEIIETAITKHNVDFILHAGDFFNRSNPPSEVIDRAVQPFLQATAKGVPVYLLPGNHERSKLPLGLLTYHDMVNLFAKPSSFFFEKHGVRIKITGFPNIRHNIQLNFRDIVQRAWNNCVSKDDSHPHYTILLLHQLIEGSRIESYTFRRGNNVIPFHEVPSMFNYLACGHVHRFQFLCRTPSASVRSVHQYNRVQQDPSTQTWYFDTTQPAPLMPFNGPVITYSGSPARVSLVERHEPKGYIIGTLYATEIGDRIQAAEFEFHPIPAVEMRYFVWDLSSVSLDEYFDQTLEELSTITPPTLITQKSGEAPLFAVFRIRINGGDTYSIEQLAKFNVLKQEATRNNIYLTFSYG
jgi:hypothetical protein